MKLQLDTNRKGRFKGLYKIKISHLDKIDGYVFEYTINYDELKNGINELVEYIDFKDTI